MIMAVVVSGTWPEPIHSVITAPEVITALVGLVAGVILWMTWHLKKSMGLVKEQVTNSHKTNFRDDLDKVGGGVNELSDQMSDIAARLTEMDKRQSDGFRRIDHELGEIRRDLSDERADRRSGDQAIIDRFN